MWVQLDRKKEWHFTTGRLVGTRQRTVLCGASGEETSETTSRPLGRTKPCTRCDEMLDEMADEELMELEKLVWEEE